MGFALASLKCSLRQWLMVCLYLAGVCGCNSSMADPRTPSEDSQASVVSQFDPSSAGVIRGQVIWQGEIPKIPPFLIRANPTGGPALAKRQLQPNPNAPVIHPQNHGVGNAVIFLREVNEALAK